MTEFRNKCTSFYFPRDCNYMDKSDQYKHSKHLILCSTEESKSYRFWNDRHDM